MGCRTEHETDPVESCFTHFTLKHSQSTSASQSNSTSANKPPGASPHQADASDHRREETICSQRSWDKMGCTFKGDPMRGTESRRRLMLHSHMCSQTPDVHPLLPSDKPLHPDASAVASLTMASDTGDRATRGKAHLGSYCLVDTGRPTQTSWSSPVSWSTDTGWQPHQRKFMLSASNKGWGRGLEFIWPTFSQIKIQVPQLSSLHCQ